MVPDDNVVAGMSGEYCGVMKSSVNWDMLCYLLCDAYSPMFVCWYSLPAHASHEGQPSSSMLCQVVETWTLRQHTCTCILANLSSKSVINAMVVWGIIVEIRIIVYHCIVLNASKNFWSKLQSCHLCSRYTTHASWDAPFQWRVWSEYVFWCLYIWVIRYQITQKK